ncbi:MAG: rhodanese-like domain-containing protein [Gammaproteobacteria bacterium]|nr:rhodanese-like domain-containing protein [Gammaproteobacteria bacterium]
MNRVRSLIITNNDDPRPYRWKPILLLFAIVLGLLHLPAEADLVREQEKIREQYPNVAHISASQLEDMLNHSHEKIVLFDVREKSEFRVSHIEGAIQIDPNMSGQEFLNRYGDSIQNRKVVFYCSVGYRSSNMAKTLLNQFPTHSPDDLLNLRYGLFGWHNQSRELVNGNSSTDLIHPYNFWWGRMIERRELRSYKP